MFSFPWLTFYISLNKVLYIEAVWQDKKQYTVPIVQEQTYQEVGQC